MSCQGWPVHLPDAEQPDADGGEFSSPVLTGCCIFASACVWDRVGTFDERMFLMFEDSDWSRHERPSSALKLLVVPVSRIRHKVSRLLYRRIEGTGGLLLRAEWSDLRFPVPRLSRFSALPYSQSRRSLAARSVEGRALVRRSHGLAGRPSRNIWKARSRRVRIDDLCAPRGGSRGNGRGMMHG